MDLVPDLLRPSIVKGAPVPALDRELWALVAGAADPRDHLRAHRRGASLCPLHPQPPGPDIDDEPDISQLELPI